VLGPLPDIHAPSSESLLAQAQTEAQSLPVETVAPSVQLVAESGKENTSATPDQPTKGASA
jgi:hypothetical protein